MLAAIANWFATLVNGKSPEGLHNFLATYMRYQTHVYAYVLLIADPFPGFGGKPGYPIDLEIDPPQSQNRLDGRLSGDPRDPGIYRLGDPWLPEPCARDLQLGASRC